MAIDCSQGFYSASIVLCISNVVLILSLLSNFMKALLSLARSYSALFVNSFPMRIYPG
jgi:hypothetical protein